MAIASGRDYIAYDKDLKGKQIVNITHKGVMLLQNPAYFIGEIVDSVSKLSPLITVLISLAALVVSIIALKK